MDPEKNRFDLFIVDGDSNVQVAGKVFEDFFTRVHTIHRSEHVLAILFEDIAKIPEIKLSDLCDTSSIFFYH